MLRLIRRAAPRISAGPLRLGEPNLGPGRVGRRLAISQDRRSPRRNLGEPAEPASPRRRFRRRRGARPPQSSRAPGSGVSAMRFYYLANLRVHIDNRSQYMPCKFDSSYPSVERDIGHRLANRPFHLVWSPPARNVGAIDSNRSRSICSIPRAIDTFQTRTCAGQRLERVVGRRQSFDRRHVDRHASPLAQPRVGRAQDQVDLPARPPTKMASGSGRVARISGAAPSIDRTLGTPKNSAFA